MVDSIGEALIRITVMLPIAALITTSVKKVLLKPSLGTPSQVPASLIKSERNTVCLMPFGSHDLKNVFSTLYIFFCIGSHYFKLFFYMQKDTWLQVKPY